MTLGGVWRQRNTICSGVLFVIKDYVIDICYDMIVSKSIPATNTMGEFEIVFRVQPNQFLYKGSGN